MKNRTYSLTGRNKYSIVVALFLLFLGISRIFAQSLDREEEREVVVLFGPRVGVTYVAVSAEKFNENVQKMYPNPEREYIPFLTQFGINIEERIPLGDTDSHFAFQQVLVVGGLDQAIFLPSVSFLIGFRSVTGFEFGLGPNLVVRWTEEELELAVSIVYAVGWTFNFYNFNIPVNLAIIPTPTGGRPRISLVSGFNFEL